VTDKGSVNQTAVLANRAAIVEQLYAAAPADWVIDIREGRQVSGTTHHD
jgi:feruloyl-CoA synthase